MTNYERITTSPTELKKFLYNEIPTLLGILPYIDFDKWCNSEDKTYPLKGKKCNVIGFIDPMIMVNDKIQIYGQPYSIIINPKNYSIYKVPSKDCLFN